MMTESGEQKALRFFFTWLRDPRTKVTTILNFGLLEQFATANYRNL